MVVRRLPESELYHHGIIGQRWGVRRYQNKDGSLTSAGRKNLFERMKNKKKMKKLRKAKRRKEAERNSLEKVIRTGDAKAIKKIQHKLTDEEYARALARVQLNNRLNDFTAGKAKSNAEKGKAFAQNIITATSTAASIANNAASVHAALVKMGILDGPKPKKSAMDLLKDKRDTLKLKKEINDLTNPSEYSKRKKEEEQLKTEANISKYKATIAKNSDSNPSNDVTVSLNDLDIDELVDMLKDGMNN